MTTPVAPAIKLPEPMPRRGNAGGHGTAFGVRRGAALRFAQLLRSSDPHPAVRGEALDRWRGRETRRGHEEEREPREGLCQASMPAWQSEVPGAAGWRPTPGAVLQALVEEVVESLHVGTGRDGCAEVRLVVGQGAFTGLEVMVRSAPRGVETLLVAPTAAVMEALRHAVQELTEALRQRGLGEAQVAIACSRDPGDAQGRGQGTAEEEGWGDAPRAVRSARSLRPGRTGGRSGGLARPLRDHVA